MKSKIDGTPHRFHHSVELQKRLESQRYRGKWEDPRRIADENDLILNKGGFLIDGCWQDVTGKVMTESVSFQEMSDHHHHQEHQEHLHHHITEFCVANVDSLTAALVVSDATVLLC